MTRLEAMRERWSPHSKCCTSAMYARAHGHDDIAALLAVVDCLCLRLDALDDVAPANAKALRAVLAPLLTEEEPRG